MKKIICTLIVFYTCVAWSQNTNYEKAWKALNENNRIQAAQFLSLAMKDPATAQDAYLTQLYLSIYNGKEDDVTDFAKSFYSVAPNPYPYVYALWFNKSLLGDYGKKLDYQLKLIDQIIADDKAPGTLVAAANYQKGMHFLFSNNFEKAQHFYDAVSSVKNWQYVGPFENLSESGFYKNYGPVDHPENDAVFKSLTNADVKWITPPTEITDGWTPVIYQFKKKTAVVYAQSFVTAPADENVYLNVGVSGSIKVWVNDELVIAEYKEKVTEMDAYTVKCDLKKGANRVLVQLGFTDAAYPNFSVRFTDAGYKAIPGISGSHNFIAYTKSTNSTKKYTPVPVPAEVFFIDKIVAFG